MIKIEIDGKQYDLELDRRTYVNLLKDREFTEVQDELMRLVGDGNTSEIVKDNLYVSMANELIIAEKIFYHSLHKCQPEIDAEQSSALLDKAIDECGMEQVLELTQSLVSSFIQGASEKKSKKTLIVSK